MGRGKVAKSSVSLCFFFFFSSFFFLPDLFSEWFQVLLCFVRSVLGVAGGGGGGMGDGGGEMVAVL